MLRLQIPKKEADIQSVLREKGMGRKRKLGHLLDEENEPMEMSISTP